MAISLARFTVYNMNYDVSDADGSEFATEEKPQQIHQRFSC